MSSEKKEKIKIEKNKLYIIKEGSFKVEGHVNLNNLVDGILFLKKSLNQRYDEMDYETTFIPEKIKSKSRIQEFYVISKYSKWIGNEFFNGFYLKNLDFYSEVVVIDIDLIQNIKYEQVRDELTIVMNNEIKLFKEKLLNIIVKIKEETIKHIEDKSLLLPKIEYYKKIVIPASNYKLSTRETNFNKASKEFNNSNYILNFKEDSKFKVNRKASVNSFIKQKKSILHGTQDVYLSNSLSLVYNLNRKLEQK